MKILTNNANGQTISLPFILSDFDIHGLNGLASNLEYFLINYTQTRSIELIDDFETADDIIADIEYKLNQLNLDKDITIDCDNYVFTINGEYK
jgi:hypothetical protein